MVNHFTHMRTSDTDPSICWGRLWQRWRHPSGWWHTGTTATTSWTCHGQFCTPSLRSRSALHSTHKDTSAVLSQNIQSTFKRLAVTTTTTVLRPFFRDQPGEPVPEENFWTLWCKGSLTEADTLTIQLGATPSKLSNAHLHRLPIFFTGRMPFLPPSQQCQSTEGNQAVF